MKRVPKEGMQVRLTEQGRSNVLRACRVDGWTNKFGMSQATEWRGAGGWKFDNITQTLTEVATVCAIGNDRKRALVNWDNHQHGAWVDIADLERA